MIQMAAWMTRNQYAPNVFEVGGMKIYVNKPKLCKSYKKLLLFSKFLDRKAQANSVDTSQTSVKMLAINSYFVCTF